MKSFHKKSLLRILQVVVFLVVVYFLTSSLVKNWSQLQQYDFSFSFGLLLLSFVFLLGGLFLVSFCWYIILNSFGEKISVRQAFSVWTKAEMVKYIPGMVWTFASRTFLSEKDKILTLTSVVIEVALKLAASLLLSFVLLFTFFKDTFNIYLVSGLVVLGVFSLHPRVFNKIMKTGCKIIKRPWKAVALSYRNILLWLLLLMGSWFLIGVGFSLLVYSIGNNYYSLLFLIGSFALAWSAGFLFFTLPGGIGVREGVMVLVLSTVMPEAVAIVISLSARVWWSIGDVLAYIVGRAFKEKR